MIRASVTAVPELFYKEGFDVHVEEFLSYIVREIHTTVVATESMPLVINQANCLHCGNCLMVCPAGAVERR